MATFTELITASSNATLTEKIRIATLIAADNVLMESPAVPDHLSRTRWAQKVFADPSVETTKMIWPVLVKNRTATLAQITGATDEIVQTAVNASVSSVALGA
jgi:hypothetical protein